MSCPGPDFPPSQPDKEALDFVLSSLERGSSLDWQRFRESHSGDVDSIAKAAEAAERYQQLLSDVRTARGAPSLAPGERLGDFEIVEALARGGMGEVYRAKQRSLGGRVVALKVLRADQRSTTDQDRFEREAMLLSELHHPNIAEVYGFGRSGPFLFLAMRLIPGDSLAHRIQSSGAPIEPRLAVTWCTDVAQALTVIHSGGLVHRDVKPSNVVLETPGSGRELAVLVDFGLARPVEGLSRTTQGIAPMTAAYAAPEQLLGSQVDGRADVFALGALLHDLLSGVHAGERQRAASGLPALPQRKGINEDLRAIVAKATQVERALRYRDSLALLQDLEAWSKGAPIQARRPSHAERAWLLLQRRGPSVLLWGFAGGCAALLVALFAWGYSLSLHADEAREAARVHDLPTLREAYAAIPTLLEGVYIRDEAVRMLARRASGLTGPDSLQSIADALEQGDTTQALQVAASRIAEVGLAGDEPVLDLLLDTIRHAPAAETREQCFVLLVLAITENPEANQQATEASREVIELARSYLRAVPDTGQGDDRQAMYALTALGALGGTQEAKYLCQYWTKLRPGSETMRLATESLARMLRRSVSTGEQVSMLSQAPWRSVMGRIKNMRSEGVHGDWGFRISLVRLATAYHLASRREGVRTDPAIAIPDEWLNSDPIRWKGLGSYCTPEELAAADDPRSRLFSASIDWRPGLVQPSRMLGTLAGLLADPVLLREHEQTLVRCGWTWREATALLQPPYAQAVEELRLGLSPLDRGRGGSPPHSKGVTNELKRLPFRFLEGSRSESELAAWRFYQHDPPGLSGAATALATKSIRLLREGGAPAVLLLGDPGSSEVVLGIEQLPQGEEGWSLRLLGQNSSRSSLPYQGISRIDLFLDGLWVETKSLSHVELLYDSFDIPEMWLNSGQHDLRISLNRESTTPYRLFEVSIRTQPLPRK